MNETVVSTAQELWERAKTFYLSMLQSEAEKSQIERYLNMVTMVSQEDNCFTILTSNDYAAEFLNNRYLDKFKNCMAFASGRQDLQLKIIRNPNAKAAIVTPLQVQSPAARNGKVSSFVSTMPLNPDYTFEEFVQGPSNSFALSAAKAICKNPGKNSYYNPFFIHGGTGLGKTHLMQAIGNELKKTHPSLAICYLTAETFLNEYINSLTNNQMQSFKFKYRNVDVLLVDDVQFLHKGKENFQEEFFNTFHYLQQSGKCIVMTSDVAPKNLPGIEARLISRFEGGIVQEIESPSYETRLAILKKKANSQDIVLPDSVLEYIADNVKSHVRAMEGALVKVNMAKVSTPGLMLDNITMSRILKDVIDKEQTRRNLTIEEIQSSVAKKFNVSVENIVSENRTQSLVTPRQMAMFISRKLTTKSLQEIALIFKKSHATILHGVKTIKKRMDTEPELKNTLNEIISEFGYNISDTMD